jgi:RNA polymerase sigma-70 factor (ECF subfamily)
VTARGLGWRAAQHELLRRYQTWIYVRCLKQLKDHHDAQDATQEVLMRVSRALPSYAGRASLRTWVGVIVDNQCATHATRRARLHNVAHIQDLIDVYQDNARAHDTQAEQVHVVMANLAPKTREVLVLRFYRDLALDEIAATLHISLSAAKMRLYRALEQFRNHYLLIIGHYVPA